MKYTLLILLLSFSFAASAQSSDSLKLKLHQYKSLYEQKLIDSSEYVALKSKLLSTNQSIVQSPGDIYKKGKTQVIGGGVMIGAGAAQIIGGIVYRHYRVGVEPKATVNRNSGLMFGVGGVMTAIGAVITAIGANNMEISKHARASIRPNMNGITASINF